MLKMGKSIFQQYMNAILHCLLPVRLIVYLPRRAIKGTTKLEPEMVPSDARTVEQNLT